MPIFWEAHCKMAPMHHMIAPSWMVYLRLIRSAMIPDTEAPQKDPPGIAAVIPPCWVGVGLLKYSMY